ncbi:MAG TPA: 3-oxoacyl-ACP reductase family protein [Chloroflexia bacterium]|nr:3-oxoacyl-ACP reductase family protein [Chloroflexia bacterium]
MKKLEGKVAIVTGSSRGIGRAIAMLFGQEGARVVVNYAHNRDEADKVVEEIQSAGGEAIAVGANVAVYDEAKKLVEAALQKFGRVDILVNNAGINRDKAFKHMTVEAWNEVINTNLGGVFNCCHQVVPLLMAQKSGAIVNIGSANGQVASYGQTNYSASKAAIIGFSRSLALELARSGITVNVVCPGYTDTDMLAGVPDDVMEKLKAKIPMNRIGSGEEIAKGVLYLVTDASYVTGQQLNVNGGLYM